MCSDMGQSVWEASCVLTSLGGTVNFRTIQTLLNSVSDVYGVHSVSRVLGWSAGSLDSTRHSKQWTRPRHSGQEQNRWEQRQEWTRGYSMSPKSINESAREAGDKLQPLAERPVVNICGKEPRDPHYSMHILKLLKICTEKL